MCLSTFFYELHQKICDIVFMAKKRVKRGYFSKVSTGKIPGSTGPVPALLWCECE
jgi:hypothetical protein